MKKYVVGFFVVGIIALFVYVGYFLYQKNQEDPVVYNTMKPFYTDIEKKTVANGSVIPRKEIALKPQISGIIDEIYVEAGEVVEKGTIVAKIKVCENGHLFAMRRLQRLTQTVRRILGYPDCTRTTICPH